MIERHVQETGQKLGCYKGAWASTMRLIVIGTIVAATFAALPACAQVYVGIGIGSAKTSGINGSSGGLSVSGDASKTSWKLLGGYQFTPNWGAEFQYTDLGNRGVSGTAGGLTASGSTNAYQWSLAGTGSLPLSSGFSLLGKLGATRNHIGGGNICLGANCANLGSSDRTDFLTGFGLGYSFTKNFGLRAEYENFGKLSKDGAGGSIRADNWALSLKYSF